MGALKLDDLPHYTYEAVVNTAVVVEFIYGIAYAMSPMPLIRHQHISHKIAWQLEDIFQECTLCQPLLPIDWKIS